MTKVTTFFLLLLSAFFISFAPALATDLTIDLKLKEPATGLFFNNLTSLSQFKPDHKLQIKIDVVNTSGSELKNIMVYPRFPSTIKPSDQAIYTISSLGKYGQNTKELTLEIEAASKIPISQNRSELIFSAKVNSKEISDLATFYTSGGNLSPTLTPTPTSRLTPSPTAKYTPTPTKPQLPSTGPSLPLFPLLSVITLVSSGLLLRQIGRN